MRDDPSEMVRGGARAARAASRTRGIAIRLLTVAGALAVAVALVEGALWVIAPVKYHEWLVWEAEGHIRARAQPNQVFRTAAGHEVRINKDGFRGPDYAYEKAAGTLRLAVFGGSAAFCYHAAGEEKTWPRAVEVKLRERLSMPVEVINLALPSFDVFNSKINYLCFGRAFHPDAIIVYHTWNDMKQFRHQETAPYRVLRPMANKPLWQRVARETQIGRRARNFLWSVTQRELEGTYSRNPQGAERAVDARALAWERKNFEDFALLAQSDGVLAILVSQATIAAPENAENGAVRQALAPACGTARMTVEVLVQAWQDVRGIIETVAREHAAIYVDGYGAVPHDLEHVQDHVHLTDAGSEVLAEAIVAALVADARFAALVERVRSGG